MDFRQVLRGLAKSYNGRAKLLEIIKRNKNKLTERSFWVLEYTYFERLGIDNVAKKLNCSVSQYQVELKHAIGKLDLLVDDMTFREIIGIIEK